MSKRRLSEWKHLVRCKRAADRIDGWYEQTMSKVIDSILKAGCTRQFALPRVLRDYVHEDEWFRWMAAQMLGHDWWGRPAILLSQVLPGGSPAIIPLPRSVLMELQARLGIRLDFESSEAAWKKKCQHRQQSARRYRREVFRGMFTRRRRLDAYIEAVPKESGPIGGTILKHRLGAFVREALMKELPLAQPLRVGCSEWEPGLSADGTFEVVNQPFQLPALGISGCLRFAAASRSLFTLARELHETTEGLSTFLLPDLLRAIHAVFCREGDLPRFLFTTSSNILGCGLSHLVMDSRKCRCVLLPYSVNSSYLLRPGVDRQTSGPWKLSLWPEFWVWDEAHKRWAEELLCRRTRVVGPLGFIDSDVEAPEIPQPAVAVFDIQPQRDAHLATIGIAGIYYNAHHAIEFLRGSAAVCAKAGAFMVLKRKRELGKQAHPSYARFLTQMQLDERVIQVDPAIAALRVIEQVDAVICMPFASPALQARLTAKPSCYYDPDGDLVNPQPAAHGIPLIQSPEELESWLIGVLKKQVGVERCLD